MQIMQGNLGGISHTLGPSLANGSTRTSTMFIGKQPRVHTFFLEPNVRGKRYMYSDEQCLPRKYKHVTKKISILNIMCCEDTKQHCGGMVRWIKNRSIASAFSASCEKTLDGLHFLFCREEARRVPGYTSYVPLSTWLVYQLNSRQHVN